MERKRKTPAKWLRQRDRRHMHISRCGRAFMPQSRMRHIRWEEAVKHAQANREGYTHDIQHFDCHCGSVECLGNAINRGRKIRVQAAA